MDTNQSKQQSTLRIDLTNEQKQQIQQATGRQAEAIELSVSELEERISPGTRVRI